MESRRRGTKLEHEEREGREGYLSTRQNLLTHRTNSTTHHPQGHAEQLPSLGELVAQTAPMPERTPPRCHFLNIVESEQRLAQMLGVLPGER